MADTATSLDAIVASQTIEPRELPRLTTGNVFVKYAQLGAALQRAVEAYKRLPDTLPQEASATLKEIMQMCDSAGKHAARLLEANQ